jgi:trimeric autotransporter adhesin
MIVKYDPILGAFRESDSVTISGGSSSISGNFVTIEDNGNIIGNLYMQDGDCLNNIAIGSQAMGDDPNNLNSQNNIAIGDMALKSNTQSHDNIAIGQFALYINEEGCNNIAIGYCALKNTTDANNIDNIAFGQTALTSLQTGVTNIAIGTSSSNSLINGNGNITIGANALYTNTSGNYNIVIATCPDSVPEYGDIADGVSRAVQIGIGKNSTDHTFQYENNRIADSNGLAIIQTDNILVSKATSGITIDLAFPNLITKTVTQTVSAGNVCYLTSDGSYKLASALSASLMPAVVIAYENILSGSSGKLLRQGDITNSSWNFTPGQMIYVSPLSAGAIAATAPVSSANQVQQIGYATAANSIYFNPQLLVMELV